MFDSCCPDLILASTSTYRAQLLRNIGLPFISISPGLNETAVPLEAPPDRAARLAEEKARAGALAASQAGLSGEIVIGSDQVAHLGSTVLHKPGNYERARDQLIRSSGNWVSFSTSICLANMDGQIIGHCVDRFDVKFRALSLSDIKTYLESDTPYDCAGSIKAEGLGLMLLEETRGMDVNTLYGLPLIKLMTLLKNLGINPLNYID